MMHVPVLLRESLEYLQAQSSGKFIDATAGDGGHTIGILRSNPKNIVLAVDWDLSAIDRLKKRLKSEQLDNRCVLLHNNYLDVLANPPSKFGSVFGIIFDLGYSSGQVDDPTRGFSFQNSGPLDMRYNQQQTLTAQQVLNHYPEAKLYQIIRDYGEERFAHKIASKIATGRKVSTLVDTATVFRLIKDALPGPLKYKAPDSARRVFQALRIEVNHELENVEQALPFAVGLLKQGGRMVVISFHSLEDRIIKHGFRRLTAAGEVQTLTKKIVTASEDEIKTNPRSKSAKLRAIEKL